MTLPTLRTPPADRTSGPGWSSVIPWSDPAQEPGRTRPVSYATHDGLHPVADAQLGQDAADVRLHGRLGDEQVGADLGVRPAARHQDEHLALAVGEVGDGEPRGVGGAARLVGRAAR